MRHAEVQSTRPYSRLNIGMIRAEQDSLSIEDQRALAGNSETLRASLPILNRSGRVAKRLLDIGLALPVIVLLLPLLCVVVKLLQTLQSPGPLFYKQQRCGRNRQPFTIMKFRTMHVTSAAVPNPSADASARIFPLGSLLRNSKLDEIPQFLNVLAGSMSIVGPRPHHYDDCKQFEAAVQDYRHRVLAKPGITGLAQYTEYRGKFQWNCVESRVSQDLRYIQNWSLLLDMTLILKTPVAIARRALTAVYDHFRHTIATHVPEDAAPSIVTIEHSSSMRHAEMPAEEKRRAA